MSRVRTVFFGTPDFARHCLQGLIQDDHFEVVGVVTQPDRPAGRNMHLTPSPVRQLVEPLGIPVLTPEKVNAPEVVEALRRLGGEVAVVVAFGQIMSQALLDLFPRKIVNVHASLLPKWRGAAPVQRAIMAGDTESGVALQIMVKKLDAGDVIGSRRLVLQEEWDALETLERMKPLALDLLAVDLMDYLRGNLSPVAQDESQVTYAHKIEKSESLVDWRWSAQQVANHVRGMKMGPGSTCLRGKDVLKIHRARVAKADKAAAPGQVCGVSAESFLVACGDGALEVLEVQPASRARMSVRDYLLGHPLTSGEVLSGRS